VKARTAVITAIGVATIGTLTVAGALAGNDSVKTAATPGPQRGLEPPAAVHHDISAPLRTIPPAPRQGKAPDKAEHQLPVTVTGFPDTVIQSTPGTAAAPATSVNFEGIGEGFTGPQGTFTVDSAPPDPNGAVGPNRFVEIVNSDFAVFTKTGTPVYGPVPANTLWSGFGGGCQANDDGDATVEYDKLADRWIISQFSVTTTPYLQCVAVSTTGDPTGTYARYSFQYTRFPDYPKLGVWPDAYYTTFNLFNGNGYVGPEICAYDKAKMLIGAAATQQCFTLSSAYGGLLPADLDGSTAPPSGSPNYILSFGTNSLLLWKFHVDWTTTSNSTLTGPATIPVATFSPACSGGGTCIPQSGTNQQLDSLADRLMYRLAYRNFGDHESLVVSHSVTAGSSVGVRWYELRNPGGTPTVFQQSTYAPDSSYRWMGSAAMDRNGDIALGYSVSSSSLHPQIHYTGRLVGDPLSTMTQGEGVVIDGSGSQTGQSLTRWGDYTSMSIDPSDDCTFWYTDQYLTVNGAFNWHTRVGAFRFPSCGGTVTNDFSIGASPSSLSVAQGGSGGSSISTAVTSGAAQSVSLSASGQPSGTTVSFSPTSVTAGGSSTMTVNVGASTAVGTYSITVTGTGTSATRTTSVSLTVTGSGGGGGVVNGDFEAGSLSGWTASGAYVPRIRTNGHTSSYSAQIGSTGPVDGDSTLTQNVTVPSGTSSLTFWYKARCTDTIAYDQIQAQIRNAPGTTTLATVLNVCPTSTAWTKVTFDMTPYAGQTVQLWFNDHDDGVVGDPTDFLLDDVAITSVTPPPVVVQNPGFETGNLNSWTAGGAYIPLVATTAHTGSYSAQIGSTGAVSGDSRLTQNVTVPAGTSTLTFWYQPHCTDRVAHDQIQAQVRDAAGTTTLATMLNVCPAKTAWKRVTLSTSAYAGQTVQLWFNDHDDGNAADPTYFLLDDVSIN
jgi:hypothetical protein